MIGFGLHTHFFRLLMLIPALRRANAELNLAPGFQSRSWFLPTAASLDCMRTASFLTVTPHCVASVSETLTYLDRTPYGGSPLLWFQYRLATKPLRLSVTREVPGTLKLCHSSL